MTDRAPCRYCHDRIADSGRRGLCWRCSQSPGIRDQYPPNATHRPDLAGPRNFPSCRLCGRGVAIQPADYSGNYAGSCSTCKRPEPERSQYHARIDRYADLAADELPLWEDADAAA